MHDALFLLELGGVVLLLAVLARLATRFGFSPIPLYLVAGLAFGAGGVIPLVTAEGFIAAGAEIGLILLLFSLGLEYSARELVDTMSDIVWAINPAKDRLSDLTHRMRRFASDLLAPRDIRFHLDMPGPGEEMRLGAGIRREVFLVFKESLHNAVKHSRCSEVWVSLTLAPGLLSLVVRDNGAGFDALDPPEGNGLPGMRRRARQLGGSLGIDSRPGAGTTVGLELPLS